MIKATSILPSRFDPDAFSREMIKEMEKLNKDIKKDFDATVSTWDHKPRFISKVYVSEGLIEGHTRTARIHGEKPPELIYYFLGKGTRVRFAKMTLDFEPKSRVRVIGSFPGRGGLEEVDHIGRPGITARMWHEVIALKHKARLSFRLRVALRKGAVASGHALKP